MHKVLILYTRLFIVFSILFAPVLYLLIFFKRRDKNKILVIPQFKRIGDIVCSTPVFRAIKEKYPNSRITVIVSVMAAGILKNNPRIDEIIIIEDYWHKFPALISKLWEGNFQYGISLSGSALSSTLLFLSLIPNRIKTVRMNRPLMELATDWLNTKRYLFKDGEYLPGHHLKLLHELRIDSPEEIKEVYVTPKTEERVDNFFTEKSFSSTDKLVGISVTAGNKIKEWGDHNFATVGEYLVREKRVKVLFIGAPSDSERIKALIKNTGQPNFYDASKFSIEELPSLMKRLSLYIASDTGPIYIAHALGIPLIDIIGPVHPGEQPPQDAKSIQVRPRGYEPISFVFKEAKDKALAREIIESIKVEDVIKLLKTFYK